MIHPLINSPSCAQRPAQSGPRWVLNGCETLRAGNFAVTVTGNESLGKHIIFHYSMGRGQQAESFRPLVPCAVGSANPTGSVRPARCYFGSGAIYFTMRVPCCLAARNRVVYYFASKLMNLWGAGESKTTCRYFLESCGIESQTRT
jgi:hypothetical protein